MLLILQRSMFLTRNLKNVCEFTVIPRFTLQLVPKKGDVDLITTQIEVRGNKNFDDVDRNNVNRRKLFAEDYCIAKEKSQ